MAFVLATDFDFIAYMSKIAFFWKLFPRQWRFLNMICLQVYIVFGRLWYTNVKTSTKVCA